MFRENPIKRTQIKFHVSFISLFGRTSQFLVCTKFCSPGFNREYSEKLSLVSIWYVSCEAEFKTWSTPEGDMH